MLHAYSIGEWPDSIVLCIITTHVHIVVHLHPVHTQYDNSTEMNQRNWHIRAGSGCPQTFYTHQNLR